jgi:hypothetical protein
MNDRNKTAITHDVTQAVAAWMDERGFKPVETEVPMPSSSVDEKGWIADLAGVISPTQTELVNLGFLPRKPKWVYPSTEAYRAKLAEWRQKAEAIDRASLSGTYTCLVEVKTSRGDFLGDRKWTADLPVDMAYLAYPKGLISPGEWPELWGVLEFGNDRIRCLRSPTINRSEMQQQFAVTLAIAIRRDHHTRFERWREYQKEQRIEEAETIKHTRLRDLARLLLRVQKGEGESLEWLLMMSGQRNLPEYVLEPIRELWEQSKKGIGVSA